MKVSHVEKVLPIIAAVEGEEGPWGAVVVDAVEVDWDPAEWEPSIPKVEMKSNSTLEISPLKPPKKMSVACSNNLGQSPIVSCPPIEILIVFEDLPLLPCQRVRQRMPAIRLMGWSWMVGP